MKNEDYVMDAELDWDSMLRVEEASAVCGVSTNTIRGWQRKGLLIAYRQTKRGYCYYKLEDLKELVKARHDRQLKTEKERLIYCEDQSCGKEKKMPKKGHRTKMERI
jgi:hypothetical protein